MRMQTKLNRASAMRLALAVAALFVRQCRRRVGAGHPHRAAGEPAVRRAAVHAADDAVRGIRHRAGSRLELPDLHAAAAAGGDFVHGGPKRRGARHVPAPAALSGADRAGQHQPAATAWHAAIGACVRPLATSAVEGRPPGDGSPTSAGPSSGGTPPIALVYFQTAQAGARVQWRSARHQCSATNWLLGEFGSTGLYNADPAAAPQRRPQSGRRCGSTPISRCSNRTRCGPSTAPCRRSC